MFIEDPDGHRTPDEWFFRSEREAVLFYGDALGALMLEARPDSILFELACNHISSELPLADLVGFVPDLTAAREIVNLRSADLAVVMEIPKTLVEEYERGRRPVPSAAAVALCRNLGWALGMLFREGTRWHPLTLDGIVKKGEEYPF